MDQLRPRYLMDALIHDDEPLRDRERDYRLLDSDRSMYRKFLILSFIAVSQIAIYSVYWHSYHVTAADFVAFYSAARVWQAGGNPYDIEAQQAVQEDLRGEPL